MAVPVDMEYPIDDLSAGKFIDLPIISQRGSGGSFFTNAYSLLIANSSMDETVKAILDFLDANVAV